jgi:hypothetical protein
MKKPVARKLHLTTETLRTLSPRGLQAVRGGTDLVGVDDPITAPDTRLVVSVTTPTYDSCKR